MAKQGKDKSKNETAPPVTNKGRLLWVCLFIFGCGWMFVLGILVGRGTAPVQFDIEKLQKELASLKEAVIKKEELRFKIDSNTVGRKTDMGFYETLKAPDGNARQKDSPPEIAAKQKEKPLAKTAVSGKETKAGPDRTPDVEPPRSKSIPALNPEPESEKKLTIQVASLRDPGIADKMVVELKNKWYPAYRTVIKVPGNGVWYRVRIGSFNRKADAQDILERLHKEKIDAVLLPY